MIAICRCALARASARAVARMLVLAVLVVQFGLVQHSIEHGAPFSDISCEVCVVGAHHAPGVMHHATPPLETDATPLAVSRHTAPHVAPRLSAHGVRAPPAVA